MIVFLCVSLLDLYLLICFKESWGNQWFFLCLASPTKSASCDMVTSCLRMPAMLCLAKPGLKSFSKPVSTWYPSPHHHGARPIWGQKEVSTHSKPAVGLVAISPVPPGPTWPRMGFGGTGDRTCRSGAGGVRISCVLSICNLVTNREK